MKRNWIVCLIKKKKNYGFIASQLFMEMILIIDHSSRLSLHF